MFERIAILGDYPGLDLRGRSFYRWARQAGAVIAILASFVTYGADGHGLPINAATPTFHQIKRHGLTIPECVFVGDVAGKIDRFYSFLEISDFIAGQSAVFFGNGDRTSRTQIELRHRPDGTWNDYCTCRVRANVGGGGTDKLISGRLTEVLNFASQGDPAAVKQPNNSRLFDENISAQLPFGGLLGAFDQLAGSPREKDRSDSQNCCGNCQNQSADCEPKFFVSGKETIYPSKPSWSVIFALLAFALTPAVGVIVGCCGRSRASAWFGYGCLGAWLLGILGLGVMAGLG